jgi:hypothetical protein
MFLNGFALHEEPCTDPYARFCGQTEATASSDPIGTNEAQRSLCPNERLVYAQHGCELMRCKSSVGEPTLFIILNKYNY